jgi:hypothetical protein
MNLHFLSNRSLMACCLWAPTAALFLLSGCIESEQPVYRERRVTVMEEGPLPLPHEVEYEVIAPPPSENFFVDAEAPVPVREVFIAMPPPPLRVEVVTVRPSPFHIWIAGYWHCDGRHYAWVAGHWVRPAHEGAVWVAPRYEHRSNGTVFIAGFWRHGHGHAEIVVPSRGSGNVHGEVEVRASHTSKVEVETRGHDVRVDVIREGPPALRHEVIVARPSPRHVWIAGYWRHDGHRYVWVSGRWVMPPRRDVIWIEPRWEFRSGGYFFVEGHWGDHHR